MKRCCSLAVTLILLSGIGAVGAEPESLFNGRDLSGWSGHLSNDDANPKDVWSVQDGVLVCTGNPAGYLKTDQDYENYVLTLEWRWPGDQGGNSGVLVHTSTPRELGVWPKSIEVQLQHGEAGDFWVIGTTIDVKNKDKRKKGRRHLNLTDDAEKKLGAWNKMEIICQDDEIFVKVNGQLVNHATKCSDTKGAIGLQSEGTAIQFRNIRIREI